LYYDHRLLLRETLLIGDERQNANDSQIYSIRIYSFIR